MKGGIKVDESTVICKCEEINAAEIETAIKLGSESIDDVKRLTRCGMGPCQAKTCMPLVAQCIHHFTGKPVSEIRPMRNRIPLRMVSLGVLAKNQTNSLNVISVFDEVDSDEV
jgi:NAD(P)H-nitrite reductase large subunit